MIKYLKAGMMAVTALFILGGALLLKAPPQGTSAQYDAPFETEHISTGELLPGETVDVNTASADELCRIPGIGEVLAQRIIDYRSENGAFLGADELLNISGIGEKSLEKLRPYIRTD